MFRIKSIKLTIILVCITAIGGLSYAKKTKPISLHDATQQVLKSSKGKILSAKTSRQVNGSTTHRIKVLTPQGRVKIYKVPSQVSPIFQRNNSQSDRNYRFKNKPQKQNSFNNSYRNNTINKNQKTATKPTGESNQK